MGTGIPGTNKASEYVNDGLRWLSMIQQGWAAYREVRDRFRRENTGPDAVEDPFMDDAEIAALATDSKALGEFAAKVRDKHAAAPVDQPQG